jgi:hypothetical protein
MTARYPTQEEFWKRLDARGLEPDLKDTLRERASRSQGSVLRVGSEQTVVSFVAALLPGSAVPAEVIAAFVDQNFDRQLGRGDERVGVMPRAQLIPAGFRALDEAAGGEFGQLDEQQRSRLLERAEDGNLPGPSGFDSALWFKRARDLALLAYASDPRGMVQMGFPGPSYKPGYLWLDWGGPEARNARRPGHERY